MTSIFIARPLFTLCYRLLCSVKYKGGDVKGIVGKARIAPPNTGNSAAPRRLPPRQGNPCKRSAHSGTVVVHVPLPRVRRAIIHVGRAIQRWLARYFVHLHVLTAQPPLEGHIVDGLLAGDGAAQHPTPNKAW